MLQRRPRRGAPWRARLSRRARAPAVRAADRAAQAARIGGRAPSAIERALARRRPPAAARVAGHGRGGAVRVLVTGATGFTGGHLARALAARGDQRARARARPAERPPRSPRPASNSSPGDLRRPRRRSTAAVARRRGRLQHRRASTGRPACRTRPTARSTPTAVGDAHRGRGRGRRRGASCTAARSACTATSSIRRPTRTRRSGPATSTRRRSSKASARRARRRRATGHRGRDRAADRHLRSRRPPAAEAVPRRGAPAVRRCSATARSSTT